MECIKDLVAGSTTKTFDKKEIIISENDVLKEFYWIKKGIVEITRTDEKGNEFLLWLMEPGDLLGIIPFLKRKDFEFTAIAFNKCTVVPIPVNQFEYLLKQNPELKRDLLKILCQRVDFIENRLASFMSKNTKQRLAEILIYFDNKLKEQLGNGEITANSSIDYPFKKLASIIGTSYWYLDKIMREFQDQGLLERRRNSVTLKDVGRLNLIFHSTKFSGY